MLVIRRLDDGKRSYTALFLPGEPAQIFPTSNYEHARLLQIYKQDRPYQDVWNDFTEFGIGQVGSSPSAAPPPAAQPGPVPPA
jgi:hypothetical protein